MNYWLWGLCYAALFLESLIAAAVIAPLTIPLARRLGIAAGLGARHLSTIPKTTLGGLAFAGAFFLVVLGNLGLALALRPYLLQHFPDIGKYITNIPSISRPIVVVLAGAFSMWLMGAVDDRFALGPRLKLALMILAALPLPWAGVTIHGFLPFAWMGAALTVLWVVFLMNSLNFLDNMDGATAGISMIAAVAFGLVAFFSGKWFMAAMFAALAGSLLGFLLHNFHPAKLFMGDNGSLFLGYLIGALSVQCTFWEPGAPTVLPVLTPLIVLGVPIFDTVSVLWIRWRAGKPLMQGDKNHFSHRLLDLGLTQRQAALLIYFLTAAVALGAIPLRTANLMGAAAILFQTACVFFSIHYIERAAKKKMAE